MKDIKKTYDDFPYKSKPFANSSIYKLESIATLLGLSPAPVNNARVLEIGCSFGGNLIMSAISNPESEFIGIDISETQINLGKKLIKDMKIKNLKLMQLDISHATQELGKFDYVISHGVYSWVPDDVKNAILGGGRKLLTDNGIMYVSYNTYPGWKYKDIIRDLMVYSSKNETSDIARLEKSKHMLKSYVEYINALPDGSMGKNGFSSVMLENAKNIADSYENFYILHEYLETFNDPCYFYEFVERAKNQDLEYLIDASMTPTYITCIDDLPQNSRPNERIQKEQYGDFLSNRAFRSSVLTTSKNASSITEALNGTFKKTDIDKLYFFGKFDITDNYIEDRNKAVKYQTTYEWITQEFNSNYPNSLNSAYFLEKYPQKENEIYEALMKFICYGSINFTNIELKALAYKPNETRIKQNYENYIKYFSKESDPVIAMATALNLLVGEMTAQDARFALMFDGKNSIDDIVLAVKKFLKTGKQRFTRTKSDGTTVVVTDQAEIEATCTDYVLGLEQKLRNAYYFEAI
ncbi:methyltransferase regulatory domain-containing protein [Campylobacter fetus]|uniref:class I SAM-dependent methyltransferase n=3 Tax=Campylobacter fetus TaxID=196 RepID=UPI0003D931DE|nr:class I SAM-dependent methyltransferase [Campylobacter fetus]OCS23328.1 hypothetical protein CFVI97532_00695 [Campylobacter fetus subsp. venerealis cfvi97/532]AHE94185.1 SAM-dependent methyltransferase [Campylobacter fetus subsp. venerealis cfvi03/293]KAA3684291.1 methyltransferase domain-containing protein [Campylobacter fetus subsp. fetus]KAA3684824.1 methyltransferase domain-containing protein [Campylobacter fetus subsp. venerealis]KAA3687489.1 methyltransferase domain-containing protein